MRVYLLIMMVAAAVTFVLVPVAKRLALALGAITQVRARDVHTIPIPRLGGVAMYAGFVVAFLVASQIPYLAKVFAFGSAAWGVLVGAGLMCLVGAVDDVWELDWYAKLAGEILAAGVMAWQGVQLVTVPLMGVTAGSPRLTIFVTIVAVVLVANAVNFVDGLDGLAAGIAGIAALAFFFYSYTLTRNASPDDYASVACVVVAALVGICAGFLPHNFHRARMFMGDSGSMLLGLLLACSTISLTGQIDSSALTPSSGDILPALLPILLPIAVMAIPLADLTLAYIRRTWNGNWWFVADKKHLHHRLLQRGHSQVKAVLIMYMWTALVAFGVIVLGLVWNGWLVAALVVLVILAVLVTVGPLSARHRRAGRDAR